MQCEKTDLWTLSLAGLSLGKKEKETICTSSSAETELSSERQSIFQTITWAFSFHLNVAKDQEKCLTKRSCKNGENSIIEHLTSISNTPSSPSSLGQQSLGNEKQSLWWCFPQWAALPVSDLSFSTVKGEIMFLFFPVSQAVILLLQQWVCSPLLSPPAKHTHQPQIWLAWSPALLHSLEQPGNHPAPATAPVLGWRKFQEAGKMMWS